MCLSLRSGLWISLWEYFSLHTITFFFLESRPRGLQNNCTSAWFDHLLPCLLQNLRFFDCFQYIAIVVLSLVKWSEFVDVTKKTAKLRKWQGRPSWHKQLQLHRERLFCNTIPLRYSPFLGHRWARFARRFISYLTPFFAFFPHCGAWSQATQMVSQLQTQLTMSLQLPEVHPHIQAGLTSVCLLIPLMLWNHELQFL